MLRVALAQLNPTVGDLEGNAAKILRAFGEARGAGAQLVLVPELCVTGYLPEDLLLRKDFVDDARRTLDELAAKVSGGVLLAGFPERAGADLYNALAVVADGEVQGVYRKVDLPNYGVFDEKRYFRPGDAGGLLELNGTRIGLTICEDMWTEGPPASEEAAAGARVLVNPSASPYHCAKGATREDMFAERARAYGAIVCVCNLVGGQDEVVFDGHSVVVDHTGELLARGAQFEEDLVIVDVDPEAAAADATEPVDSPRVPVLARAEAAPVAADAPAPAAALPSLLDPDAEVYAALLLGLRDYVEKNGFERVVLGLSGGIDSALVACLAHDALGADRVTVAIMPSPHSADETQADARRIAANLGVEAIEMGIEPAMGAYSDVLADAFEGTEPDLTEENVQARIRGNLLMALSNKFGWLVLTTGNKSEMSVGYSTLYGDLAGGLAVIKDVPKTLVYRLVRHRNARPGSEAPVPDSVLERAPSAELRPDQRDDDSLPPYDLLDRVLEAYVEEHASREEMVERGLPAEEVDRIVRLVDRAEYKRRQAPPGIKVTPKAFGRDRRMPITNRYDGAAAGARRTTTARGAS